MTTRPLYRVGPEGVRRVVGDGEIYLGEFAGEQFIPLPDMWIASRMDPVPPPSPEEIAELEAEQAAARERHALWGACRDRELRGEPPGFSAWVNEKVIHLSYTPFCAFPSTGCGIRVDSDWKTAVGIQDMHRGRVCKRCAWNVGRSVARSLNVPQPSSHEYFVYKQRRETKECPGSGFQATGPIPGPRWSERDIPRVSCPECGVQMSPRLDGKLRTHRIPSQSSDTVTST